MPACWTLLQSSAILRAEKEMLEMRGSFVLLGSYDGSYDGAHRLLAAKKLLGEDLGCANFTCTCCFENAKHGDGASCKG